ncbi:MAG: hypothetical protein ISS82_01630 [Nanoarchaeota archaeon]|nr:hypothetical protein [Nanoarchaeota archaeon]
MKILVGCPTSEHKDYCLKEYVEAVKKLNCDVLLIDNSEGEEYYNKIKSLGVNVIKDKYYEKARDRIVSSRNLLKERCLKNSYDYLFSLEQDVIPPLDVIERLLKHGKKIIGALYFKLEDEDTLSPLAWVHHEGNYARRLNYSDTVEPRLMEVITCGLGCVLIHKDVLEKVNFRYDKNKKSFDDIWFGIDAREHGFKLYLDTSIKCKHLIKGMDWDKLEK